MTTTAQTRLAEDLKTIEIMVDDMEAYLESDNLFGPTLYTDQPLTTLGGYFLREHRLQALSDNLLEPDEQARLEAATSKFARLAGEYQNRMKEKIHQELAARINQWDAYLEELDYEEADSADYYHAEVEKRAIIAAIIKQMPAYVTSFQLGPDFSNQIDDMDNRLRQYWQSGPFVWPSEWKPAYPSSTYWWLDGRPNP